MKALSIVSPSGSKIASGEKRIEVRSWKPDLSPEVDLLIIENGTFLREENAIDPAGRVVAIVRVVRVRPFLPEDVPAACASTWVKDYFSWELSNVRRCEYPFAVAAKRGIYDIEIGHESLTQG